MSSPYGHCPGICAKRCPGDSGSLPGRQIYISPLYHTTRTPFCQYGKLHKFSHQILEPLVYITYSYVKSTTHRRLCPTQGHRVKFPGREGVAAAAAKFDKELRQLHLEASCAVRPGKTIVCQLQYTIFTKFDKKILVILRIDFFKIL